MSRLRLFVYGSLKRAGLHHDQLENAEFLGEVETTAGYALEPLGDYLALVAVPGAGSVAGELFEISESRLPALDDFEGDAYFRGQVSLSEEPKPGKAGKAGEAGLGPRRYETAPRRHETALAYFKKAR